MAAFWRFAAFRSRGGGLLRTYTDVTERHRHQQNIEHPPASDSLTGLPTAPFMECLAAEVYAGQAPETVPGGVVPGSGWSSPSTTPGHAAGDQVLVWGGPDAASVARESQTSWRGWRRRVCRAAARHRYPRPGMPLAQRPPIIGASPWTLGQAACRWVLRLALALYPEHGMELTPA